MRATTAFNRIIAIEGVSVEKVTFVPAGLCFLGITCRRWLSISGAPET
jgi:hypothetical protein